MHNLNQFYIDRERDFEKVRACIETVRPRMIVVDSLSKAFAGKENDADMRFALDDLQMLARDMAAPVVLIHHLRKRQVTDYTDTFDFDRLRGSSVLAQCATSLIGIDQPDRHEPPRRVSCGKASLGPMPEPFGFEIADSGLTFTDCPESQERVSKLDEAKDFLKRALAEGPRPASEVKEEAKREGVSEHTLRRARRDLCGCEREVGAHNRWVWSLQEA